MSNLSYRGDANVLWKSREVVRFFKTEVFALRDKQYSTLVSEIQLGETLEEYFNVVGVTNAALRARQLEKGLAPDQFLKEVLKGIKPLVKSKKSGNPKGKTEGAVILAFLSDQYPEIAKKILDFAASETERVGCPKLVIEYRPFVTDEPSFPDPVELESKKLHEKNIVSPWIPPQSLPSPQKGETWKITDRWHPRNAHAYWMGWKIYFLGLPKKEIYNFNNIIWTKNDIRAVAISNTVCSTAFSFPVGEHNHQQVKQHNGVALFGRNERYSETVQLASVNPDNTAFVFSDELVLAYTENVEHGALQQMYFKPPFGDSELSQHMYRHPYYKSDKRYIERYGYRRVLAVNSDGDIIVFGNHGYGRNYKKSQIDIFEYKEGDFNKIDEWEGSLISNKDLLPHPKFPKVFFRMPDRVERVGDIPITLIGDDQWKINSDRYTVAWHPDLPLILVNSIHKNEKNKTALLIIDYEANTCIEQRQTSGSLTTVEWSPDGRFIVFATVGNALSRWDLNLNTVDNMFSNNSAVERVSISPSGDRVAVQDWGSRGNIAIFDINTFEVVTEFRGSFMDFKETPWNYSGRYIAYVLDCEVLVRRLEF